MENQQIVIGLILDQQKNILISKRKKNTHLAGLWEFAGGKVERGESLEQALKRELNEELGIIIEASRPFIQIQHQYKKIKVTLNCFLILKYQGQPVGRENQQIQWYPLEKLDINVMPFANKAIIQALQLPTQYLITPHAQADIFNDIEYNLKQGIRLIQLRQKSEPIDEQIAKDCLALCHQYQAKLLINQHIKLAKKIKADGVHLTSKQLNSETIKTCQNLLIAASCHSKDELEKAERLGVDFALLSPVYPTKTHPAAQSLGLNQFQTLIAHVNFPVYGLGGLSENDLSDIFQAGGQGIAGIRCFLPKN